MGVRTFVTALLISIGVNFYLNAALPQNAEVDPSISFDGGLYTNTPGHLIPKQYSPDMRNVMIDNVDGRITTRKGFDLAGATATLGKINFLYEFNIDSGNKEFILSDSSTVLSTKDFSTFTLLKNSLNKNYRLRAKQIRNKLWFTNGINSVFTYDGSTVTVLDGQTYGATTTPNVPKGKYIEYWLDRVWIYSTPTDDSELDFSALYTTDTVPIALAPDNALAWPQTKVVYVGRGDGQKGHNLFILRGRLYAGKEKSIYAMFGDRDSNFQLSQIISGTGLLDQQNVTVFDNMAYFVGSDGFNSTDGAGINSISDKIRDRAEDVTMNAANVVSNIWNNKSTFDSGAVYYNSTAPTALTILTTGYVSNSELNASMVFNQTTTASVYVPISTQTVLPLTYSGRLSQITYALGPGGGNACFNRNISPRVYFKNNLTNEISTFVFTVNLPSDGFVYGSTSIATSFTVNKSLINNNNLLWKIEVDTSDCSPNAPVIQISSIGALNESSIMLSTNTGQYKSAITTIPTINFWDSFLAESNTNGGDIQYYIKTATSAVNIDTQTWINITPGSIISAVSTNKYIQWSTTMTASDINLPPIINSIEIRHNEGGASGGIPFHIGWRNRWWLFVSTDTNGTDFNGYIKCRNDFSNPTAWVYFTDIPIYSIVDFNGNLYGGGDGKIYRLDYGTNDNGSAINAYYQVPDSFMGNLWKDKKLLGYFIDAQADSGKTLYIDRRTNYGDFIRDNISFSGSNRKIYSYFGVSDQSSGNVFGFRIGNNQLDKSIDLNSFATIYKNLDYISGVDH